MPLNFATHDAGRPHVLQATQAIVDRYLGNASFTSIDLPPRSGKSSVIHLSAFELTEHGAPFVIAVAPWNLLPDQLVDRHKVVDTIRRYCPKNPPLGVHVDRIHHIRHHRFYEREGAAVSLYAATLPLVYRNELNVFDAIASVTDRLGRRPVILMDEAHLCSAGPKGNRWGAFIERAADEGAYVVCLTGTRVRADGQPVPGFHVRFDDAWDERQKRLRSKAIDPTTGKITHFLDTYKVQVRKGEQEADYKMTWQEAWERGFLNQVNILWADADLMLGGEPKKISELPAEVANKNLRKIVEHPKIIEDACRMAVGRLHLWRKVYGLPKTKMLVTTGSDLEREVKDGWPSASSETELEKKDNWHARQVKKALRAAIDERFPPWEAKAIRIEIATTTNSDDDQPNEAGLKIAAFRGDERAIEELRKNRPEFDGVDIVIVKSMGLVGLDVPELKVQLSLSTLRDGPMMLQERSRSLTVWPEAKDKPSDLILPCDKANQSLIEKMRDAGGVCDTSSKLLKREEIEPATPPDIALDCVRVWLAKIGDHTGDQIECDDSDNLLVDAIRSKFPNARCLTDVVILKLNEDGAFPLTPEDMAEAERRSEGKDEAAPLVVNLQDKTNDLRGKFGKRARRLAGQVVDYKVNIKLFREIVSKLQCRAKELAGVHAAIKVKTIDDPAVLERLLSFLDRAFKEMVGENHAPAA